MIFPRPIKYNDALKNVLAKQVLPLAYNSRAIEEELPAEIRRKAMFSARNQLAADLANTQDLIGRIVAPAVRVQPDGSLRATAPGEMINMAKARTLMRKHLNTLGYLPPEGKEGGLQDLASDRRLALVINTQTQMARGEARDKAANAPGVLRAFPADELYRGASRRTERNWQARWNNAKASLGAATSATTADTKNGPFVAPKNDPIWTAISRFGNAYAPFDYRSGMRKRSVPASRAAAYGITSANSAPEAERGLRSNIPSTMSHGMLSAVLKAFKGAVVQGGQIVMEGAL